MKGYPLLDAFLTIFWLFIWIMWIFLLIRVISDVFRSHDMGGWAKALWVIFIIIMPFLGVFVYLIARGGKMHERQAEQAALAGGSSNSDPMRTVRSSMTALASSLTAQFHACGVLTALLRRGHRQPALPQRPVQPLRQRACFQPDPLHSHTERFDTAIRASGSLGTFTSRTILPLSSTTHTLELFRDTSIPA